MQALLRLVSCAHSPAHLCPLHHTESSEGGRSTKQSGVVPKLLQGFCLRNPHIQIMAANTNTKHCSLPGHEAPSNRIDMERTSSHTSSPSPCSTSGRPAAFSTQHSFDRSSSSRRQVCREERVFNHYNSCRIQQPIDTDVIMQTPRQTRHFRKKLLVLAAAGEVRSFTC